jgi:hypothetical protein
VNSSTRISSPGFASAISDKQNRVLAASRDDDAIDRRIETRPSNPRRPRGTIVPRAGVMLVPEDPRAGRARNRCARRSASSSI